MAALPSLPLLVYGHQAHTNLDAFLGILTLPLFWIMTPRYGFATLLGALGGAALWNGLSPINVFGLWGVGIGLAIYAHGGIGEFSRRLGWKDSTRQTLRIATGVILGLLLPTLHPDFLPKPSLDQYILLFDPYPGDWEQTGDALVFDTHSEVLVTFGQERMFTPGITIIKPETLLKTLGIILWIPKGVQVRARGLEGANKTISRHNKWVFYRSYKNWDEYYWHFSPEDRIMSGRNHAAGIHVSDPLFLTFPEKRAYEIRYLLSAETGPGVSVPTDERLFTVRFKQ